MKKKTNDQFYNINNCTIDSLLVVELMHEISVFSPTLFRLRELHTLKGHVESVVKLKGLDIDTIQQHYTV